ncbi:MAG TPA: hypothetical protein VD994_13085 [Prosthecobacter sp.]|nr:hypothetical protein [Prosthecobacter sp.]
MAIRPFPHLKEPPKTLNELWPWLRDLFLAFARVKRGKLECVGELTLSAGVTSTTLTVPGLLSPQSVVCFDPKTANAATELYGATMYVLTADRGNDTWTITHANNGQTDRTFQYSIIG